MSKIIKHHKLLFILSIILYVAGCLSVTNADSTLVGCVMSNLGIIAIAAAGVLSSGAIFADKVSSIQAKCVEAPNESVKKMLESVVQTFTSGPCCVIELRFPNTEVKDAVERKIGQGWLVDTYREACKEAGVELQEDPGMVNRAVYVDYPNRRDENIGIKNLQIRP